MGERTRSGRRELIEAVGRGGGQVHERRTGVDGPGARLLGMGGSHLPGVPTPIYGPMHQRTIGESIERMFARYGVPLRDDGRAVRARPGLQHPAAPVRQGRRRPAAAGSCCGWRRGCTRRSAAAPRRLLGPSTTRCGGPAPRSGGARCDPSSASANLALQAEDLGAMDDIELVDHLERAVAHMTDGHLLHFDLHGDDLGPLGLYLAAATRWGIEPGEAIAALAGHSPSTAAPVEALGKVAAAVLEAGWAPGDPPPATIAALRALGPERGLGAGRLPDRVRLAGGDRLRPRRPHRG